MNRLNTERTLAITIGLFVLAVAASIAIGAFALVKAFEVDRTVQKPTVRQSRGQISLAIGRYSKPQLRMLLRRLLSVADPAQVKEIEKIRRQLDRAPRRRDRSTTAAPRASGDNTGNGQRPQAQRTPRPDSGPRPQQPSEPDPVTTAAPPTSTPAPAPAATPKPQSVIKTTIPAVPLQVCTGLLDVNCP